MEKRRKKERKKTREERKIKPRRDRPAPLPCPVDTTRYLSLKAIIQYNMFAVSNLIWPQEIPASLPPNPRTPWQWPTYHYYTILKLNTTLNTKIQYGIDCQHTISKLQYNTSSQHNKLHLGYSHAPSRSDTWRTRTLSAAAKDGSDLIRLLLYTHSLSF